MRHTDPTLITDFSKLEDPEELIHRLMYDDGSVYTGHTFERLRHGFGKLTFPDGSVYEGNFECDKFHGDGTYIHSNGDVYNGEFLRGKASGYGTLTQANGLKYEGEWLDDHQHGRGREYWSKDFNTGEYLGFFEGEFRLGKKSG